MNVVCIELKSIIFYESPVTKTNNVQRAKKDYEYQF